MSILRLAALSLLSASALAQSIPPAVKSAEASIDAEKIRAHVKFLSDDLLEGRGPGMRGDEIAAQYIATQFALYGLKPGGDNGTYLQQVNFVGTKTIADKTKFSFVPDKPKDGGMSIQLYSYDLKYGDDYTVNNRKLTETADFNAPIVFVGYGVVAPEYGWNDYAGIDVKGKVVLCIVGDPPSDDPEVLRRQGAHLLRPLDLQVRGGRAPGSHRRAHHPPHRSRQLRLGRRQELQHQREDLPARQQRPAARSSKLDSTRDRAQLFHAANLDLDTEMTAAGKKGFKAVPLPVRLEAHIEAKVRSFQSPNIVAILPGAQRRRKQA